MSEPHTILLIDDEEDILEVLEEYFKEKGYRVLTAATGEEGIEIARGQELSMVLVDLRLPGADGTEVVDEIRKIDSDLPVVIITAYPSFETAVKAIRARVYDYYGEAFSDVLSRNGSRKGHPRVLAHPTQGQTRRPARGSEGDRGPWKGERVVVAWLAISTPPQHSVGTFLSLHRKCSRSRTRQRLFPLCARLHLGAWRRRPAEHNDRIQPPASKTFTVQESIGEGSSWRKTRPERFDMGLQSRPAPCPEHIWPMVYPRNRHERSIAYG